MSRRIGQTGNVFQHCKPWNPAAPAYGRYWIDIPGGGRKRRIVALGICGPRSVACRKLREHIEREGINRRETFIANTSPATTFGQQAEKWLSSVSNRHWKPVRPATLWGWRNSLNRWLLPLLGDKLLAEVGNAALKSVIEKMAEAKLSPQTIITYTRPVKMILASAVNPEGEQIYPRKWNHSFIGLPVLDQTKQRRPTVTQAELEGILARLSPRYAVLVAVGAGTGLREGEALGLKVEDLSPDYRVLHVRRSIWHGQEQEPKTPNAVRVVDVPVALSEVLREHCAGRTGYVFATRDGKPLQARNVHRILQGAGGRGFHALRRYRAAVLRKARVPEDLVKLWLGHAVNLTDTYALQLREDLEYRQHCCAEAGLGFQYLGYVGLQNAVSTEAIEVV